MTDSRPTMALYHRIAAVLRHRISDSQYPVGSQLPTVDELAVAFSVSRVTVSKALSTLVDEGLVVRQQGRGTFVRANDRPRLQAAFGRPIADPARTATRNVQIVLDEAFPEFVASALQMANPFGTVVRRTRTVDGEPVYHTSAHFSDRISVVPTVAELETGSLTDMLVAKGVPIDTMTQTIRVAVAGPRLRSELEIELGEPVLAVDALVKDPEGNPLELVRAWYRSDRCEYNAPLTRRAADGRLLVVSAEPVPMPTPLVGHAIESVDATDAWAQ